MWWWYHGHAFHGYQSQRGGQTVQDTVLSLLNSASLELKPVASGRTDAGVHARMQVLSGRLNDSRSLSEIRSLLRASAAQGLGLVELAPVHPKFHAHFSLTAKTYRYRLVHGESALWQPFAWQCQPSTDFDSVVHSLKQCEGEHRFDAFHDSSSSLKARRIFSVKGHLRHDNVYEIEFSGAGFARYQIRFLVGAAVQVALGEKNESDFSRALYRQENRHFVKAPAQGLTLWSVSYPQDVDPFATSRDQTLSEAGVFASP
jgi:tRNA pseudouridine38-40 synthase